MATQSAAPAGANNSSNLFGFTEFQLDPLDAQHTPPHRLRESCRTFTLCLEPCAGTPLERSLKRFQDISYSSCGPNRAHDTTPHISILGRIQITKGEQSQWRTADRLKEVIAQQVKLFDLTAPVFIGYQNVAKPTRALAMQVHVTLEYAKLARSIHRLMTPEQGVQFQTIPPINRIYLAYDILKSIPQATLSKISSIAKDTIDVDDWVLHGQGWQLSLYEVILESRVKGVQQQASLVESWKLSSSQTNAPSPWLPTSLRVKLAVLSRRCFGPPTTSLSTPTSPVYDNKETQS